MSSCKYVAQFSDIAEKNGKREQHLGASTQKPKASDTTEMHVSEQLVQSCYLILTANQPRVKQELPQPKVNLVPSLLNHYNSHQCLPNLAQAVANFHQ